MRKFHGIILVLFLIIALILPVQGMPAAGAMSGTIIEFNATSGMLVIEAACETQLCSKIFVGKFQGKVPEGTDNSAIHVGDLIEVSFIESQRSWDRDPKVNFELPSWDTRTVDGWIAVGILAKHPQENELILRLAYGDTQYLQTPFAGSYAADYRLFNPAMPSDPREFSWWPATGSFVLLKQNGVILANKTLNPGEQFEYRNTSDNSTVRIRFITGKLNEWVRYPAPTPGTADFAIQIMTRGEMQGVKGQGFQKSPFPFILTLIAVGCVYLLSCWRTKRNK